MLITVFQQILDSRASVVFLHSITDLNFSKIVRHSSFLDAVNSVERLQFAVIFVCILQQNGVSVFIVSHNCFKSAQLLGVEISVCLANQNTIKRVGRYMRFSFTNLITWC